MFQVVIPAVFLPVPFINYFFFLLAVCQAAILLNLCLSLSLSLSVWVWDDEPGISCCCLAQLLSRFCLFSYHLSPHVAYGKNAGRNIIPLTAKRRKRRRSNPPYFLSQFLLFPSTSATLVKVSVTVKRRYTHTLTGIACNTVLTVYILVSPPI